MREILRTNDNVLIGFAESVLRQAGIGSMVADQHMSIMEGSIGAFPRRLLIVDEDWRTAREVLTDAGLDGWLAPESDARA